MRGPVGDPLPQWNIKESVTQRGRGSETHAPGQYAYRVNSDNQFVCLRTEGLLVGLLSSYLPHIVLVTGMNGKVKPSNANKKLVQGK